MAGLEFWGGQKVTGPVQKKTLVRSTWWPFLCFPLGFMASSKKQGAKRPRKSAPKAKKGPKVARTTSAADKAAEESSDARHPARTSPRPSAPSPAVSACDTSSVDGDAVGGATHGTSAPKIALHCHDSWISKIADDCRVPVCPPLSSVLPSPFSAASL